MIRDPETASVTVAICSYNGAARLPATLEHLRKQCFSKPVRWEVLLIDNASTDGTAEVARICWGEGPGPLRIVRESILGISNARERARIEARHEIIAFVDDDNWVNERWVERAAELMGANPAIGAAASLIYPVFEEPPPLWWYDLAPWHFALTLEVPTTPPRWLNSAGLLVRKKAWDDLMNNGFISSMESRIGGGLLCGEDTEMTHSLYLAGWELRVDSELRALHFLPKRRLTWSYLRRLVRESSISSVLIQAYLGTESGRASRFSQNWQWQTVRAFRAAITHPRVVWKWLFSGNEGDPQVIDQERAIGRFLGLLRYRGTYTRLVRSARVRPTRDDGIMAAA